MASQVAVAEVAVVPTFKGFRRMVSKETDTSAKTAASGFSRIFSKTGADSGKNAGSGFKRAFEDSAKGTADKVSKALEANVAKTSRALSTARLREQDAIGKVRVAQAQLNEANQKYARDSSQVIRAQERLETASRQLKTAHERTEEATEDLKKAQSELARAADRAGDEIADAGDKGIKGFRSNVTGGVKSFSKPLVAAFAALGIGNIVADAFRDAKNFVLGSIDLASGLEQSIGGVDAGFKDSAKQIHDWAEGAAEAVGLSRNQYNELSTVIGSQLKNMGVPLDDVTKKTGGLIELAADLAATYGGTTADAVSAVSSLLRGERDPIERYGVSISDAVLEARLLAKGLDDLEGPAKDEAKRQETLAALYEQTTDAQGAFTRESDTLAGKQQRMAAEWDNLQAKLGEKFLPVMSDLVDLLTEDVFPVIDRMVDEHGPELAQAFEDVLPSLVDLAEELLPQLPGLVDDFAEALPGMLQLIKEVTPIVGFLSGSLGNLITIWGGASAVMEGTTAPETFGEKIANMNGPIADVIRWLGNLKVSVENTFGAFGLVVQTKIDEVIEFIRGFPERAKNALGDLGKTLVNSGRSLIEGFLAGMKQTPIGSTVSGILDWVRGYFPNSPAKRGPFSGSGWTGLQQSGEAFWDQWLGGMGGGEPPFPDVPSFPPAGGGSDASAASTLGRSGPAVSQVNHFDKTDPREGAELANQMLAAALRGA